jgi:hypothetical protein
MKKMLLAAAAAVSLAAPAVAEVAVTLDRDVTNNDALFFTSDTIFNLPTNFTNARINFTNFAADDAAVLVLNGTALFGVGIFGPGQGTFRFEANGPATPFTFNANGSSGSITGPFQAGQNTISFIVNNNNAGINPGGGGLTDGPSSLTFTGNVTYDLAAAVPEPATWALMIGGFGMVGAAARRRTRTAVMYA